MPSIQSIQKEHCAESAMLGLGSRHRRRRPKQMDKTWASAAGSAYSGAAPVSSLCVVRRVDDTRQGPCGGSGCRSRCRGPGDWRGGAHGRMRGDCSCLAPHRKALPNRPSCPRTSGTRLASSVEARRPPQRTRHFQAPSPLSPISNNSNNLPTSHLQETGRLTPTPRLRSSPTPTSPPLMTYNPKRPVGKSCESPELRRMPRRTHRATTHTIAS